jgi:hypothetical protein
MLPKGGLKSQQLLGSGHEVGGGETIQSHDLADGGGGFAPLPGEDIPG